MSGKVTTNLWSRAVYTLSDLLNSVIYFKIHYNNEWILLANDSGNNYDNGDDNHSDDGYADLASFWNKNNLKK